MKVLSLKQPCATLVTEGYKKYEFRTWKTKYRSEIYIHAGKITKVEKIKNKNIVLGKLGLWIIMKRVSNDFFYDIIYKKGGTYV